MQPHVVVTSPSEHVEREQVPKRWDLTRARKWQWYRCYEITVMTMMVLQTTKASSALAEPELPGQDRTVPRSDS